jgi:hypothetical protein
LQEGQYTRDLEETLDLLGTATLRPGIADDMLHGGLQAPAIDPTDLLGGIFSSVFRGSLKSTAKSAGGSAAARMAVVSRLGKRGKEALARALLGLSKLPPKTGIKLPGMSTMRFPDLLTSSMLVEVKNTARLSLTPQITDMLVCAQKLNVKFRIYYRPGAKISGNFDGLPIELIPIPPAAPLYYPLH